MTGPEVENEGALFARVSAGLLEAQRRLRGASPERQEALQARLIAITNSSKHDLGTAAKRLDALLSELPESP